MKAVVADANALIMPFKDSINIDSELARLLGSYEIIIPAPIIGELEKLAGSNKWAKMALSLARTKKIVESKEAGDMSIIDVAEHREAIILTNDRELIELASVRKVPVIRLKSGKMLGFEEGQEPIN